jgi:hypothetical protein
MFLKQSATVKCSAWQIRLKIIEADRHPGTTTKGSDPAQRRVEPDLPERGQQIVGRQMSPLARDPAQIASRCRTLVPSQAWTMLTCPC